VVATFLKDGGTGTEGAVAAGAVATGTDAAGAVAAGTDAAGTVAKGVYKDRVEDFWN
jgi:hypothetical protein